MGGGKVLGKTLMKYQVSLSAVCIWQLSLTGMWWYLLLRGQCAASVGAIKDTWNCLYMKT